MKKLISAVFLVAITAIFCRADMVPVLGYLDSGRPYTVTQTSITVSSVTPTSYPAVNHYREFYFQDASLTAGNSYYYRMDATTTTIISDGGIFAGSMLLESNNAVSILAPAGLTGRALRVRIREK